MINVLHDPASGRLISRLECDECGHTSPFYLSGRIRSIDCVKIWLRIQAMKVGWAREFLPTVTIDLCPRCKKCDFFL